MGMRRRDYVALAEILGKAMREANEVSLPTVRGVEQAVFQYCMRTQDGFKPEVWDAAVQAWNRK